MSQSTGRDVINTQVSHRCALSAILGHTWGDRCLGVARYSAIGAVVSVPISTAMTSIAVGVMLLAWLLSGRAIEIFQDTMRQPVGLALAAFLLVAATGLLYGAADFSERWNTFLGWRRLAYALVLLGLFGAVAWKRRFAVAFVVACALWVVLSYLAWWGVIPSKNGHPSGVLLQNHATQGITFALGLLCAAQLWSDASPFVRRSLMGLGVLLVSNILFVTSGRSGFLALFIVLVVWGWARFSQWRAYAWIMLVSAGMVLAYAASPNMRNRVDAGMAEVYDASGRQLTSIGTRVLFYETSLQLIEQRPVFGYGAAGFGRSYREAVQKRYNDWRAMPSTDPHNIYLFVTVEHGLVGLAVFVGFLIVTIRSAPRDRYGWIGLGTLFVIMGTSLFSSHFRTFPEGHLLSLFLGAMLARSQIAGASSNQASAQS